MTNTDGTRAIKTPSRFGIWFAGARPQTLTLAASPVIAAGGLAYFDRGMVNFIVLLVTLVCAIAIQVGTNYYNDAADAKADNARRKGRAARVGPVRLTAQGLADEKDVKRAALLSFGIAGIGGSYLVAVGGWPILLIGIASIGSGYSYSAGARPLSHTPFGEIFVIAFFGIAAVTGTYYLQTGIVTSQAAAMGLGLGALAAAVLMVNNIRDREQDNLAGRRTLALVIGGKASRISYAVLLAVPFVIQLIYGPGNWLPMLTVPFAVFLVWRMFNAASGDEFNVLLAKTARLQFAFSLLIVLGFIALKTGHAG